MSRSFVSVLIPLLILALIITAFPAAILAQDRDTTNPLIQESGEPDFQATGLNEPTEDQANWVRENFPVVSKIRLNSLGVKRIRQEYLTSGRGEFCTAGIDIARAGSELEFGGNSGTLSAAVELPGAVDNSTSSCFPPVRSQGSIGSCVAWATTYYQFSYENNLARGRAASSGNNDHIFSPKWTYNLINDGVDGGAYFSDAYAVILQHGAATWSEFPYNSNYLEWCSDSQTWRNAINCRPLSRGLIFNSDPDELKESIKTQLANGHLLVIATYVSSWVSDLVENDPDSTLDDPYAGQRIATYMKDTRRGGHAMTIVVSGAILTAIEFQTAVKKEHLKSPTHGVPEIGTAASAG